MLLGRRYITHKYKIHIKKKKKENDKKNNITNVNYKTNNVSESISVISSLIIKLIKYMNSPISLNKIIIGNNFIKNTRLDNFLFFSHIKEITFKLILYFISLLISLRYKYINSLFILTLFFINIILSTLYLIFSKINRNVAMEYILAQAIYAHRNEDHHKGIDLLDFEKKKKKAYQKYSYDYMILFGNTLNYY
nr:probable integral membrane protein PFB0780c - malaria parasite (Plasmodium falciparum) [Plasmodium falciparum]